MGGVGHGSKRRGRRTRSLTIDSIRERAPEMTAEMTDAQVDDLRDFLYQLAEWYALHLDAEAAATAGSADSMAPRS